MATHRSQLTGLIFGAVAIGLLVSSGLLEPISVFEGLGRVLYVAYPIVLVVLFVLLARRLLSSLE